MAEERPPPEDSLRHLRCRGMTTQGFPLEIPILADARWYDVLKGLLLAGKNIRRQEYILYTLLGRGVVTQLTHLRKEQHGRQQ